MRLGDAINAMMDGETVVDESGTLLKMNVHDDSSYKILYRGSDDEWCSIGFVSPMNCSYELAPKEYPLNDWQALKAMHEGKIVESGYVLNDGDKITPHTIKFSNGEYKFNDATMVTLSLYGCNWRIVDE